MGRNNGPVKHGVSRYRGYKCRCDLCVAAYAEFNRLRRKHTDEVQVMIDPAPLIALVLAEDFRPGGAVHRQVRRWEENGLDVYEADRQCVRRGFHPLEVFGDAWLEAGL